MRTILFLALAFILGWGHLGINLLLYFGIALLVMGIIVEKEEDKIVYVFFLLPWSYVIGLSYFAFISLTYFVTMLFNSVIFKKRKISIESMIITLLFILVTWVGMFPAETDINNALLFYSYFSIFIILATTNQSINLQNTLLVFSFSLIASCFIGLTLDNFGNFQNINFHYDITNIIYSSRYHRFTGLDGDPNFLSFNIMMAIAGLNYLLCNEFNRNYKKIYFLMIVMLSIFGFLTLSNTYIIVWFLYFGIYFFIVAKGKRRMYFLGVTMLTLVVLFIISPQLLDFFTGGYLYRIDRAILNSPVEGLSSLTKGRSTIWADYFSSWGQSIRSILFGKGNMAREDITAHNTFIRFIYMFGLLGSIFFVKMINEYKNNVKHGNHDKREKVLISLSMLVFIIFGSMLDMFRGNALPYFFPYIVLLTNYAKKREL